MFDTGNTGFMLVATSLVMLMTPGLAFFYGGLVGRKNVLAIMFQSFVSMGVTTIIWWAYGYSLCFSGGEGGIIGNLDKAFLAGVTLTTPSPFGSGNIPEFVFKFDPSIERGARLASLIDQLSTTLEPESES